MGWKVVAGPRGWSSVWSAAQRPRAKLPGGSGQTLPTLRLADGRDKQPRSPSPPAEGPRRSSRGVSRRPFVPDVFTGILVISQGFSELLGSDDFAQALNHLI